MFNLFKKRKQEPETAQTEQTNESDSDIQLGDWIQFQYHRMLTSLPTDSTLPSVAEKIRGESVDNLKEPVTWRELVKPILAMGVELGVKLQLQAEMNIKNAEEEKLARHKEESDGPWQTRAKNSDGVSDWTAPDNG